MLKTSGLVLDVYDDVDGNVLRDLIPSRNEIPDIIKQAHALSPEERGSLPDEDFALVLMDGNQRLRKYACHDAGNTALSVLYFVKHAHKLPEEAQKVAAENLATACGWYDLDVPEEITKISFIGALAGKAMGAWNVKNALVTAKDGIKSNLNGIRTNEGMGNTLPTLDQMKTGEVSGTSIMPLTAPPDRKAYPDRTVVRKTAEATTLVAPVSGTQPTKNPQAKAMHPHVDVTNKEPPKVVHEKKASRYALEGRYPLDNYEQVKCASVYFEEYGDRFSPEQRRGYCTELHKRASELGIQVSERVQKYGSEVYAPPDEIKIAMDTRRNILLDENALLLLEALEEKRAMIPPELFCATLGEFDKIAGINYHYDKNVVDPYLSTYGVKTAEDYSFIDGNDMVTEKDLIRFGKTMFKSLHSSFGEDFAEEFHKDPVAIFKSMPLVQKKMIMHLATDNAPGTEIVP